MAPLSSLLTLTLATTATAFSVNSGVVSTARPSTKLYENFGFDFAEDQAKNTPSIILGENNYKKWVNSVDPNNMLNRQMFPPTRVLRNAPSRENCGTRRPFQARELGLTLEKAEELLPVLEKAGVLSLVANNQQLLINGVAPLAVEGAPLLLPVVAGALEVGPAAFYLAAATFAGLDVYLFTSGAEVPFIGLSAGAVAGLVLIPLSVVSAVVGGALGSLKN
eukprot:CCRYP_004272-RA/>CCRYP_004272-RA protein AED:0.22 eAED:0.23 QI:272/0/0.33/1/1/1/3/0/220